MAPTEPTVTAAGRQSPKVATEIRVHGIGDHNPWSALGSPVLVVDGYPREPDVAIPPTAPSHEIKLVNWSRKSRKVAGQLWYVALPFTLVNAASFMRPPSNEINAVDEPAFPQTRSAEGRTVAASVTGVLLTLLTFVWSLALLDTVARRTLVQFTSSMWAGPSLAIALGLALLIGLVSRSRRDEIHVSKWLLTAHVAVVAGATAVSVVARPSHWQVSRQVPELFTTWGPSATFRQVPDGESVPTYEERIVNGELVPYLDAVVTTSLAVIAVVAVIAALAVMRGLSRQAANRASTQEFGSALALLSAVLLFVSVASAMRLFLDNGLYYLARHDVLPGGGPGITAPFKAREILPPLNTSYAGRDDWIVDLLPIMGILGLAAMALALVAVNLLPFGAGRLRMTPLGDDALARATWKRALVLTLPMTLGPTLLVSGILWVGAMWFVSQWVIHGSDRVWSSCVVLVQVLSAITVILVITGRGISTIRKAFGLLADIIGFWPVNNHPFAGASYRDPVLQGLREQLVDRAEVPTVLVGHSQGSVLCAWLLHRDRTALPNVHLITCGSPLKSLYREFFPAHFSAAFFQELQSRNAYWLNFWRSTDPIATRMPGLSDEDDNEIPDPTPDGSLKVHSDYWIAAQQRTAVGELIGLSSGVGMD